MYSRKLDTAKIRNAGFEKWEKSSTSTTRSQKSQRAAYHWTWKVTS